MLLLPVKGFELWKSVWAGWLSLGVTWLVSGGHQLLINARLNADLRYHLLLWLLCNYAREVTSLSVVATMLLYNVSNITLTSKGRTSYWKLHGYNKNWYHLCPGYHSTMPNQCMSNLLLLFPNPHSWTRYNSWKRGAAEWKERMTGECIELVVDYRRPAWAQPEHQSHHQQAIIQHHQYHQF